VLLEQLDNVLSNDMKHAICMVLVLHHVILSFIYRVFADFGLSLSQHALTFCTLSALV